MRAIILAAGLALAACGERASAPERLKAPSGDMAAAMEAARAHVAANEEAIVRELRELLALPNVASNHDNIRRNAEALVAMLERRGVAARVIETPGAPVNVVGELVTPGAERTLLFYAHFDGQPVEPLDAWASAPFTPTLRAGRLGQSAVFL